MSNNEILGAVLGALFIISGGVATIYKMMNSVRDERDRAIDRARKDAEEYTDTKFELLRTELDHQKEMHEGKVAQLALKIEELKEEVRGHHAQLMDLLTKMLEK